MNSTDDIRERIFARNPRLRADWEEEQQRATVNELRKHFHLLTEGLDPWELRSLARWLQMWKR